MPDATGAPAGHRIGYAIKQAIAGERVTRRGWKVAGQYITYCHGNNVDNAGQLAYLVWNTRSGKSWPATLSQRDLLADDWMVVTS